MQKEEVAKEVEEMGIGAGTWKGGGEGQRKERGREGWECGAQKEGRIQFPHF